MAGAKLSQAEIDALLSSMNDSGEEVALVEEDQLTAFDFRRPSKFAREHLRSLETAHEVFVRRATGLLTQSLRAVVSMEPVSTDQITYEDYTRSIPTPSVITTFSVAPLPGLVVMEMSTQMGLTLIDRLLGGIGAPVPMRRPTDLEGALLHDLMEIMQSALHDALEPLADVHPEIQGIEFNPQFVQAVPPNEMVLMLTYELALNSTQRTEGLLSICYPFSTLAPAMSNLENHVWRSHGGDQGDEADRPRPLLEILPDVEVPVTVQLRTSPVPAVDIAQLRPGDVIRLEHRVDEPAVGVIGDRAVLSGRIGRRGRRLAIQIADFGGGS
ncbi:MAG: flagellar motor switch protein FliM [Actinomycetota bacterium]